MAAVKTKRKQPTVALADLVATAQAGKLGLLGEVVAFVREYVVMTPAQLVAVALWIMHTHVVEAAEQTPYLLFTSPEKQCGKTRALETVELLVVRPWNAVMPSEAVVYRNIQATRPTLLLDEVDTIFNPRVADKHEGLRALLNAGNRRGAKVPRCVGNSSKIVEFRVYGAKALAGIGTLPDTITDRSVPIRLHRRSKEEPVSRLRRREVEPVANELCERIAEWAEKNYDALADAEPPAPEALSDRMQDACEPLLAIAHRAKHGWVALAEEALVELCTAERQDDQTSMRVRLLADVRAIFLSEEYADRRSLTTSRLLEALVALPDAPWGRYYGHTLESRDLAVLLRHYGIKSQNIRLKNGKVLKGYLRRDLQAEWEVAVQRVSA